MEMFESPQRNQNKKKTPKSLRSCVLKCLERTAELFGKEISASEMKTWSSILDPFSDVAIEWAFDNWARNGQFFPKPSEILGLVHTFGSSPENQATYCGKCNSGWIIVNPEAKPSDYVMALCSCVIEAIQQNRVTTHKCDDACKRRHGRGYHTNDVMWLFKRYREELKLNPKIKPDELLDELDGKRQGGIPEWRKVGGVAAKQFQGEPIRDDEVPF